MKHVRFRYYVDFPIQRLVLTSHANISHTHTSHAKSFITYNYHVHTYLSVGDICFIISVILFIQGILSNVEFDLEPTYPELCEFYSEPSFGGLQFRKFTIKSYYHILSTFEMRP